MEDRWLESDSNFTDTEISFATWTSLSEKHLNLLRLTGKVASEEFAKSASRYAAPMIENGDSHELVAFLQESWNLLSVSNEDVFQSFGKELGKYTLAISSLVQLVLLIEEMDDLSCDKLKQLQSLLESILDAHFNASTFSGVPWRHVDIPILLAAWKSAVISMACTVTV